MKNIIKIVTRHIAVRRMANFFEKVERNPVTRTPKDVGLEYEDLAFKSLDGVNLKAWHIPSNGSDKLVIFNHFMLGNRAGAVPQEDWGNVSVDFMPIYKHLVNAGYCVFTYDLRNHGESDVFNNGRLGLTNTEYQDVVASIRYAKEHFAGKKLFLYSQCYGTVSTILAMEKNPKDFEGIEAFVNIQPLTPEGFVTGVCNKFDMANDNNMEIFDKQLKRRTGYSVQDVRVPAEAVKIPTLTVQVHDDWRTTAQSIEEIHANLGTDDKKLLWIEDEDERLEGYNYFARNPEALIEWFDAHN